VQSLFTYDEAQVYSGQLKVYILLLWRVFKSFTELLRASRYQQFSQCINGSFTYLCEFKKKTLVTSSNFNY